MILIIVLVIVLIIDLTKFWIRWILDGFENEKFKQPEFGIVNNAVGYTGIQWLDLSRISSARILG